MAVAAAPKLGDLLENRYKIRKRLGQGASGAVFLADDTRRNRRVALKYMHNTEVDQDLPSMFAREFKAISSLNHPNCIRVFDLYQNFFTMEYIEGQLLEPVKLEDISQLLKINVEICRALSYIHRTGLIHGDLKPPHVLIDRMNQVKLIDFGLAKQPSVVSAVTIDDMVLQGTVEYMAPEQIKGLGADARSDLYSQGVMMYELATGQKPFHGDDFLQVAMSHLRDQPTDPREHNPTIPEEVAQLILTTLEKNPAARFQSADELGRCLLELTGKKEVREKSVQTGSQYLFSPAFVGREAESMMLDDLLARAVEGTGSVIFVRGPSGIGKTRLLREFKAANLFGEHIILSGHPTTHNGAERPYFVELLHQSFRALHRFNPDREQELIWDWSLALGRYQSEAKPEWFVDNIVTISALEPKVAIDIVIQLLTDLLDYRTLILVVDDMESITGFGGQLLDALALLTDEHRCIIVAAYDDEKQSGYRQLEKARARLKSGREILEIRLSSLDQKNLSFLIESMVSQSGIDSELVQNIGEITKGNPLFIEETVRSLAAQHIIYKQGGRWEVDNDKQATFKLPTGLESILLSRVEGLGKSHRVVLFTLATSRSAIGFSLLKRLTRLSEIDLFYMIGDLEARGLVTISESDRENVIAITNDSVASVLYKEGTRKEKKRLHTLLADDLERRNARRLEPVLDNLIYHCMTAGNTNKAIQYLLLSGERNERQSQYRLAEENYRTALKRLDRERQESTFLELCHRMGRVSRILGNLEVATSYLVKGLDQAQTKSQISANLAYELGLCYHLLGDINEAIRYLHYSLNLSEAHGAQNVRLRIEFGKLYSDVGNYPLAEQYLIESEVLSDENKGSLSPDYLAGCRSLMMVTLGEVRARTNRPTEAVEQVSRATALADSLTDPTIQMEVYLAATEVLTGLYKLDRAQGYLSSAMALADRVESRHAMIGLSYQQGLLNANRGFVERALQQTEHGIKLARTMESKWQLGYLLLLQGRLFLEKDAYKKTGEVYEEVGLLLGSLGDKRGVAAAELLMAKAARLAGEYESSLLYLSRSRAMLTEMSAHSEMADVDLEEAKIRLKQQEPEAAIQLLDQAIRQAARSGNWNLEGRAHCARAAAAAAQNDHNQGASECSRSIALFRENQCPLELAKTLQFYGLYLLGGLDREPTDEEQANGIKALAEAVQLFMRSGAENRSAKAEVMLQKFERQVRSRTLSEFNGLDDRYDISQTLDSTVNEVHHKLDDLVLEVNTIMPDPNASNDARRLVDKKIKEIESTLSNRLDKLNSVNDNLKRDISFLMEEKQSLSTLQTISHAINSETDLDRLITMIIDLAIEQVHAERGFLILRNTDGKFVFREARNIDRDTIRKPEFKVSFTIAKRVVRTGEAILTANAQEDARFKDKISVHDLKLKSVLCVPLKLSGGVIGAVYVDNRFVSGLFADKDLEMMSAIASQASVALEKAQLLYENRMKQREVEKLNEQLSRKYNKQRDELDRLKEELHRSREAMALKYDYSNIIGNTPRMQEIFSLLDKITDSNVPVLIEGNSGTGKELVARAIHFNGPLKKMPFAAENCAALSETLLESELFGHVRGAFTGADRDKKGVFEVANGGTLFLDEVGEMSQNMQKKLLRVLQEGEFRAVGGKNTIKVKVRLVSATNKQLRDMMAQGEFREDLFYRLNVINIQMPSLHDRIEDLPLLVDHFLTRLAEEHGTQKYEIDSDVMQIMMKYHWPGNVRELQNEITRLVALSDGLIPKELLSQNILLSEGIVLDVDETDSQRGERSLKELEHDAIIETLAKVNGNKVEAAKVLGIDRTTLYNKMRRYGIKG